MNRVIVTINDVSHILIEDIHISCSECSLHKLCWNNTNSNNSGLCNTLIPDGEYMFKQLEHE